MKMTEFPPLKVYPFTLTPYERAIALPPESIYSRTSMARTLMARLPQLLRTRS